MLSEQTHCAVALQVHLVHQRIRILRKTSRKYNEFVVLRHDLQEVVNARSLLNEDVAHISIDVHRNHIVGVFNLIELAVHQSFVEVQYQCLFALAFLWLRS